MTPQRIGSHYLLHEQIGQGGMGSVWRAEDVESGTWRAIKVLRPEYARDPGAVMRFVRERNALVALRHPNVVALHDMIVEGERLALVMDLLTEGDLDKFRRDHGGTFPLRLATELIAQVCEGLAAAHALGIVHRDLKPANVLMDGGRARLTDFGIARIVGEASATTAGTVMGTIYYMAPEALGGAEPAPASDMYAAGVTLYELLAGRPPFTGQAPVVITGHLYTAPPRPDGLPDPLWRMIAACLSKDPAARPTAAQLAAALRDPRAIAGAPPAPFPARTAQPTAPAQPMPSAPVSRPWPQETEGNGLDAGQHTVTGIGWLTPAGPARSPAPSDSSTWSVSPAPPAPPAPPTGPANGKGSAKRRRTMVLAAVAALVLAGAGTVVALVGGSGGAQPRAAGLVTTPTATEQASLAATGSAVSPAPSGSTASASPSAAAAPTVTVTATTSVASPAKSTSAAASATTPTSKPTPTPTVSVSGVVIENLLSKWCLDVAGGSTAAGAAIQEGNCVVGDTSEQWRITGSVTPNSNTYYQYQNVHSGLCLDVSGASQAADAALVQEPCNSLTDANHSQVWRYIYTSGSDYELADGHSALCAGAGGGSTAENSPMLQGNCIGASIQTWYTLASP